LVCASPGSQNRREKSGIDIMDGAGSVKAHTLVDYKSEPLNFMLTGGHIHGHRLVNSVLGAPGAL
jgi:hypothetical protein